MVRAERQVTLRNAEKAELFCSGCPMETDAGRRLSWFIEEAWPALGKPDLFSAQAALGRYEGDARNYFFWAEVAGEIVSTAWYMVPADDARIGGFGEVFTLEHLRGLGLATETNRLALEHFQRGGGQCLFLGTGEPAAERIYTRLGFRGYPKGLMRFLAPGAERFEAGWFAPGQHVAFRDVGWGDLPRLVALYGAPNTWASTSFTDGFFSRGYVTPRRCNSFFGRTYQRTLGGVWMGAFAEGGAMVGSCPVAPLGNEQQIVDGVADVCCHPHYHEVTRGLLAEATEAAREKGWRWLSAFVAEVDREKLDVLREAGFEESATLPEALSLGGELHPAHLLRKRL